MEIETAIYIAHNNYLSIAQLTHDWFKRLHRNDQIMIDSVATSELSLSFYHHKSKNLPTLLALSIKDNNWLVIRYNSFDKMGDLAQQIANKFHCQVLVVMRRNDCLCYYLAVYKNEKNIREIESINGIAIVNSGRPLPFERKAVVTFNEKDLEFFCAKLGLNLYEWMYEEHLWKVLKISSR